MGTGMVHIVMKAKTGTLLFHTWDEASELWRRLIEAFPGLVALVLMPDHVHLVVPQDDRQRVRALQSGYARWRNARRGQRGAAFEPHPQAVAIPDRLHLQRTIRYIHLNPCRARLVNDPLDWPFSTHRDAVGLAWPAARRPEDDPARFHAYVSGDPSVSLEGTHLPWGAGRLLLPDVVVDALSAVMRTPHWRLVERKGADRRLAMGAARDLTDASLRQVGAVFRVTPAAVRSAPPTPSGLIRILERVAGDARFEALDSLDLRRRRTWGRYRAMA